VPGIAAPPFGVIEKALPATACVWSRGSDHVPVAVTPSEPTLADMIVGALVSQAKLRVAAELSVFPSSSVVSTVSE
jgi:hypothetical protein